MKKFLLLICLLIFTQTILSAQSSEITFSVSQEKIITYKNQIIELVYTVENNSNSSFRKNTKWEFPAWNGLEKIGEPTKSTSMTIINGKRKRTINSTFYFIASDIGTFIFPPATFSNDDTIYKSSSVEIIVLPELQLTDSLLAEQLFLKVELNPAKAMVGERVKMNIRMYSLNLPKTISCNGLLDDFQVEGISNGRDNYRPQNQKENIMMDDIFYTSFILFSKDIYPNHEGNIRIPSMRVSVATERDSSFFTNNSKREILKTNPIELEVYSLEEEVNAYPPINGNKIDFHIIDTSLHSGIIYLNVMVRGKSDPMFFSQPKLGLEKIARVELINTKERLSSGNRDKENQKTFQYKVSFIEKGKFDIRPEWSTWDTEKKNWTIIFADSKNITVPIKANYSPIKEESIVKDKDTIPHAIVFALDLSSSMLTQDFSPSRIGFVQERLKHFINNDSGLQKHAIVGFAGETGLLCPLTSDVKLFTQGIDQTQVGIYEDGTAIGDGLMHSIKVLSPTRAYRKTIVLITDGSQNTGKFNPLFAAKIASQKEINIVSLGIGSDKEAMTPIGKSKGAYTYQLSNRSKIDETTLKDLAQKENTTYSRVLNQTTFDEALKQILESKNIELSTPVSPINQKLLDIYFERFR